MVQISKTNTARDYGMDNLRFVLIFSVVFGHLLEICQPFLGSHLIYQVIYSFHMSAFIFLFGYYSKHNLKRIVFRWLIPYLVFQPLYGAFDKFVLGGDAIIQPFAPYGLMWYMMACIFYQLLSPLYDRKRGQVWIVAAAFVVALLAGFVKFIGYPFTLSRFLVFQPWFILGFYCRKYGFLEKISKKMRIFATLGATLLVCGSILLLYMAQIPDQLLFGSYAYQLIGAKMWMRLVSFFIAFGWIVYLFVGIRPLLNRNLGLITRMGQNTWPVFLLHGFMVSAAPLFYPQLLETPLRVFLFACGIVMLTANPLCKKLVEWIGLQWLEK